MTLTKKIYATRLQKRRDFLYLQMPVQIGTFVDYTPLFRRGEGGEVDVEEQMIIKDIKHRPSLSGGGKAVR